MADRKITSNWRGKARKVIAERYNQAILEIGMDARRVRRYIAEGYPFGPKMKYPYRVWLEELAAQMEVHRTREYQLKLF